MENGYYDGPVKDTDRTIKQIEDDIKAEKERCEKINNWEDIEKCRWHFGGILFA